MAKNANFKATETKMALYTLLVERKEEILSRCRTAVNGMPGGSEPSWDIDEGLPVLYAELIDVMEVSREYHDLEARQQFVWDTVTAKSCRDHAERYFRVGCSISQLVHGYGAICQSITEFAHEQATPITAMEFGQLNFCLDVAIAQAVTSFEKISLKDVQRTNTLRIGETVHELRNALSGAVLAHEMIRSGKVGSGGATSRALTQALQRMTDIIDREVADIRLGEKFLPEVSTVNLLTILMNIEIASMPDARSKDITVWLAADPTLNVAADPLLITSAFANLVHNAIKFSSPGSTVAVRGLREGDIAVVEVEDCCGGLDEETIATMFDPEVQHPPNGVGMGLGLSIVRRVVEQANGEVTVESLPGKGCVFTVRLPILTDSLRAELLD